MIATLFWPPLLLFFGGGAPKIPPPPPPPEPPPPPPEKTATQIETEAAATADVERKRKGGQGSILTGSAAGDLSPAPTNRKTLLGQ